MIIRRNQLFVALVLLLVGCSAEPETAIRPFAISSSGSDFPNFRAGPAKAKLGIVLVHDWFGITDFSHETMVRLAGLGYDVLAVDLYDGARSTTHAEANKLMGSLDQAVVKQHMIAAITEMQHKQRPIVVLGFSMGGEIAYKYGLQAGTVVSGVGVIYGGFGIDSSALAGHRGDLLLATGSADGWAMGSVKEAQSVMATMGRSPEVYIYPGADHAYAQILYNEGANFDAAATRATWGVIEDFLGRQVASARK